jgi:SAM-dependent methyltransferase
MSNIYKDYNIKDYIINNNPSHHDDTNFSDEGQKEVYQFCAKFMAENKLNTVVDVGCGSGYKLIKYLGEFDTKGIETEPCFSLLNLKYPDRKWLISGEKEKSFNEYNLLQNNDVVLCCDVIEHIIDPDVLLEYLISLNAKYYIISTPCREILCKGQKYSPDYHQHWNGPPKNPCHVREWTMNEFTEYISNKFDIIKSFYGENQIECQYHLLTIK